MDYTPEELEDLAHMHGLLARLKACADARVEAMERMTIATTPLEMQRQARALKATSDLVISLYTPKRRARPAAPKAAPKPDSSPKPAPKPRATSPEAAMLRELEVISRLLDKTSHVDDDEPDVPAPAPAALAAPEPVETPEDLLAEAQNAANAQLDATTQRFAQWVGHWRDGTRVQADDFKTNAWHRRIDALRVSFAPEASADACQALIDTELLRRANVLARGCGEVYGCSIESQPWRPTDPDHFTVSVNRAKGLKTPAPGERSGYIGLPWWIVHVPPVAPTG